MKKFIFKIKVSPVRFLRNLSLEVIQNLIGKYKELVHHSPLDVIDEEQPEEAGEIRKHNAAATPSKTLEVRKSSRSFIVGLGVKKKKSSSQIKSSGKVYGAQKVGRSFVSTSRSDDLRAKYLAKKKAQAKEDQERAAAVERRRATESSYVSSRSRGFRSLTKPS